MIPSRANRNNRVRFRPGNVAEIAAGYFWDPSQATGLGATLVVPEGNGKTAYNMITPAANTAPTGGVINGQVVAQYANGSPDQLMRTAAGVQRGWTGATYFACWIRAAAAVGSIFGHWRTAQNLLVQLNGGDSRIISGATEQRFSLAPFGATAFFLEAGYDPSLAASARFFMAINRVALTQTTSVSVPATLPDTGEYLTAGGTVVDSTTFNYAADFATGQVYLGNGIPSAADRDRLYRYKPLAAV